MSKKTHWKWIGFNIEDMRTEDEKKRDELKAFKDWMKINRMPINKPKHKHAPKREDNLTEE